MNNYELLCETASPTLTSICQAAEQIGYEAASLLTEIVQHPKREIQHLYLPPGELIPRRSTDYLAINDSNVAEALTFIRENAGSPITVDDVLDHVPVSRRTLDIKFIEEIGHPPAQEIRLTRINKAQQLLAHTQ